MHHAYGHVINKCSVRYTNSAAGGLACICPPSGGRVHPYCGANLLHLFPDECGDFGVQEPEKMSAHGSPGTEPCSYTMTSLSPSTDS
eukprot:9332596-Alexandrium_andersonii.AAC.1